jgi:GAF domain-containing protein
MLLTKIKQMLAAPVFEGDENKTRNARLLNVLLWALLVAVTVPTPVLIFASSDFSAAATTLGLILAFALPLLGLVWLLHRGSVRLASVLLSILLLVVVTATVFIFGGIRSTTAPAYLLIVFVAGLLLGGRGVIVFGLVSIVVVLSAFYAERYIVGGIARPLAPEVDFDDLGMLFGILGVMTVVVSLSRNSISSALDRARRNEQALAKSNRELQNSQDALRARTRDLERQSRQLRAAAVVSRDVAAAREIGELLGRAVNLIQDNFEVYHAGIYLLDEAVSGSEYAILRAATGEAGRQMLQEERQVRLSEEGIVSYVINNGYYRIALDGGGNAVRFDDPLLPLVRSEIVLPLRAGGRVIGALDVQSEKESAFDEQDVAVLQAMADQLAATIENVRLLASMQQTVRELEAASGRYAAETPQIFGQRGRQMQGYRYRRVGIEPIADLPPEARQAWAQGRPVVGAPQGDEQEAISILAVPIKLREQVEGVLNLCFEGTSPSANTISLIGEITDRLALALENARLLGETRQRAERDRLTADITARVRASMDVQEIMQVAVQELTTTLGVDRAFIRVGLGTRPAEE